MRVDLRGRALDRGRTRSTGRLLPSQGRVIDAGDPIYYYATQPIEASFVADEGITLNGSDVAQWNDRTVNGRDLAQGTASAQPAYLTNEVNGHPAIQFVKADSQELSKTTGDIIGTGAYTLIAVIQFDALAALDIPLTVGASGVGGVCLNVGGGANTRQVTHLGVLSEDDGALATGNWELWLVRRAAGGVPQFRVNGVVQALSPGTTNTLVAGGAGAIIAVGALGASNFSDCRIAEFHLVSAYLPDDIVANIEAGRMARYGL